MVSMLQSLFLRVSSDGKPPTTRHHRSMWVAMYLTFAALSLDHTSSTSCEAWVSGSSSCTLRMRALKLTKANPRMFTTTLSTISSVSLQEEDSSNTLSSKNAETSSPHCAQQHEDGSVATTASIESSKNVFLPLPGTLFVHPLAKRFRIFTDRNGLVSGTRIHLINAILSLVVATSFFVSRRSSSSSLTAACMMFGFCGLVLDNTINAFGKYLGEGRRLRLLTKVRLVFHGTSVPLLFLPILEAAKFHGLLSTKAATRMMPLCVLFSIYELWSWITYDSQKLQVVDNRDSLKHSVRYLAGTLAYTSGRVLQCVLPVAILSLAELGIGYMLVWKKPALAGRLLLSSGVASLVTCSIQRPDIQIYGETVTMGLIWAMAVSIGTTGVLHSFP